MIHARWNRTGITCLHQPTTMGNERSTMSRERTDLLSSFASGEATTADRWTAARELMARRELISVTETHDFISGFRRVGEGVLEGNDFERLIAVDLIVRLSRFAKKLGSIAEDMLRNALKTSLPPFSLLSESDSLPEERSPRSYAKTWVSRYNMHRGNWVVPYVVQALMTEDRSQRCRLELARQLAARERTIDQWLSWIVESRKDTSLHKERNLENAAGRLRDIATALAESVKHDRTHLEVSKESGIQIKRTMSSSRSCSSNSSLPRHLGSGAAGAAKLLDEIFAVKPYPYR